MKHFCNLRKQFRLSFLQLRYLFNLANTRSKSQSVTKWRSVVGLEIHAQILAESKLFSGAATKFAAPINQQVAYLDAALPGTLPVLNHECVMAGVRTALALNCRVNLCSKFDRKHYFYADLPTGYQITQQREPLGTGGTVPYVVFNPSAGFTQPTYKSARLIQLQLEQDSGKSLHDTEDNMSLIDLNRAGMALMEIVTEPDFTCGEEAASFVKELQHILQTLGTCNGIMAQGAMRVDASISIHHEGEPLGVRREVKNINSIRNVAKAIDYEIEQQILIMESGGKVESETRMFDANSGTTLAMRDKERLHDYRFMPEPNLPPLRLYTNETVPPGAENQVINVDDLKKQLPELPNDIRRRLLDQYGMHLNQACTLVNEPGLAKLFEEIMQTGKHPVKAVLNMLLNNVLAVLNRNEATLNESYLNSANLEELIDMREQNLINHSTLLKMLDILHGEHGVSAAAVLEREGWQQITDPQIIADLCDSVIKDNHTKAMAYKNGKIKVFKSLMGNVLRLSEGKAEPKITKQILKDKLDN